MPLVGGRVTGETNRFELKSAPPDGYIVIRRLAFGDKMLRRSMLGKATVKSEGGGKSRKGDFVAEMELINERVALMEFSRSIVDHNLTILTRPGDASSEVAVDFSNPVHIRALDGTIGEEIDEIIMQFNDLDSDDEVGKLPS